MFSDNPVLQKFIICLILLLGVNAHIWSQLKNASNMLEVEFEMIGDLVTTQGHHFTLGYQSLALTANLWQSEARATHVTINLMNTHGDSPSADFIGDLQVVSNIEAGYHTGLFEAFIEQRFNKHSILLGQHDLNGQFLYAESASMFTNSSFGIMPTVSCNVSCSIFPLAAVGVVYAFANEQKVFKLGVYDGNPGSFDDNRYNLSPSFSKKDGILGVAEFNIQVKPLLDMLLKVGTYFHSNNSVLLNKESVQPFRRSYGTYLIAENNRNKLQWFVKTGYSPKNRSMINAFFGAGLIVNSILKLSLIHI
jgi:porin